MRAAHCATPAEVIDRLRRNEFRTETIGLVLAIMPHAGDLGFATDLAYTLTKMDSRPELWIFSDRMLSDETLARIPVRRTRIVYTKTRDRRKKGAHTVSKKRVRYITKPDELKKIVDDTIRTIHEDADPEEMNAYRRFIKRHVSVFSRGYFTAFLLRELARRDGILDGVRQRSTGEPRQERTSEGNVPPDKRQTLFVSVGKNRRVYPKDFLALFTELDGVEGDRIGQIKILDNYSFVEVDEEIADAIIGAYDGYEFRGRKLTVNFARNKK